MAGCAMRIGQGYDVHKLVPDRKLILGGVDIPYEKGLLGHSDADVIVHAVMDALLGAAGLWDIGHAFPDDDPETDGISSLVLLKRVKEMLDERGFAVVNIDGTIIAQRPKLSSHIPAMRQNIAEVLGIEAARINLKATTEEGLGFKLLSSTAGGRHGGGAVLTDEARRMLRAYDDYCEKLRSYGEQLFEETFAFYDALPKAERGKENLHAR